MPPTKATGPSGKPRKDLKPVQETGISSHRVDDWGQSIQSIPSFSGWQTGVLGGWTPEAIRGALAGHAAGNFQASGRLYTDLLSNTIIRHGLEVRQDAWVTLPQHVTASSRGEGRRCADFVREVLPEILPPGTLRVLHEHYLFMGFCVAAIDWEERTDGKDRWWLPVIKPWHPSHVMYRWDARKRSADGGTFLATTLNDGQVVVEPGMGRWLVIGNGTLQPWMRGSLRSLGELWLGDVYNFYDNQSLQERYARGFLKLFFPVQWKDTEIRATIDALRNGGSGGVLPCPSLPDGGQKVDADLLRIDASGYGSFDSTDRRIVRRILIDLLGQDMTTVGQTGGFAQAVVHADVLWHKREHDAAAFGDAANEAYVRVDGDRRTTIPLWRPRTGPIRSQIMRWVSYFNFGSFDLAPYVWWDATPPEDYQSREKIAAEVGKQKADTLSSLATALDKIRNAGIALSSDDVASLFKQCGLIPPASAVVSGADGADGEAGSDGDGSEGLETDEDPANVETAGG